MSLFDDLRAWATSQSFANLNSPTSYKRFVELIVSRFIDKQWPGEPEPRILDHGGTSAFRDRADGKLPAGTRLCTVNPGPGIDATYKTIDAVPNDFRAHLIMVFGTIEYYDSQGLDQLFARFWSLMRPGGTLLISETNPEAGIGSLLGGLGHRIDEALTGITHWREGDVRRKLGVAGFTAIEAQADLIPNVMGGINPVWVLSAQRPS